jgi:hypothetical protein
MSQPAAPAATIVTTRFLNQFGRLSQRRQGNNNGWGVECNWETLL